MARVVVTVADELGNPLKSFTVEEDGYDEEGLAEEVMQAMAVDFEQVEETL